MRRSFTKRAVGACVALMVVLGVGGAWASSASSGPPGDTHPMTPYGPPLAPGENIREITRPGGRDDAPAARWHNCQVVKVKAPVRVFEVEKPNGTKEQRSVAQADVKVLPDGRTVPLGPARHDVDCVPTEEQVREMHHIAGVDPDTRMPIPPRP